MSEDCCLLLRGEFFIKDASRQCPSSEAAACDVALSLYSQVGNTSTCEVSISANLFGKENKFNPVDPRNRAAIEQVTLNFVVECASMNNLAMSLYGKEAGVTGESHTERFCYDTDRDVLLTKYPAKTLSIVGLDSFGNVLLTLVEGIHYRKSGRKITILHDQINQPLINLRVVYEFDADSITNIGALVGSPKYKEVFFVGKNVSTGEDIEAIFYRVLFAPITTFDLISKGEFVKISLSGIVEESSKGHFKITKISEENNGAGQVIY